MKFDTYCITLVVAWINCAWGHWITSLFELMLNLSYMTLSNL